MAKKQLKKVQKKIVKKTLKKVTKKINKVIKPSKKTEVKNLNKNKDNQKDWSAKSKKLIARGRDKGFITYDEIIKEFPTIEQDVEFLSQLYDDLQTASIDVLEGGGFLEVEKEEDIKK